MNEHKQLKKLGTDPSVFFDDAVESKKSKKHIKKERKKYGCSAHEVYNLNKTMPMWLYEHLILYKECAIDFVDFGAANGLYDVPVAYEKDKSSDELIKAYHENRESVLNIQREKKTLGECIDLMIDYLKFYIFEEDIMHMTDNEIAVNDLKKFEYLKCAMNILAETIQTLWI